MVVANTNEANSANDTLSHIDQVLQQITSRSNASRQWVAAQTSATIDKAVTPEQRKELSRRAQGFADSNPRLAAFLAVNLVLSGVPVLLFLTFSISTFVFSVLTGLIIGLIGALVFTATSVGVALFVLLPVLFFSTITALLLFTWGLVAFAVLRLASQQRNNTGVKQKREIENARSTEQHHEQDGDLRVRGPKQNGTAFQFASDKQLPLANQSQSTLTAGTALPADRKLTDTVSVKQEYGANNVKIPTTGTTGMVAS